MAVDVDRRARDLRAIFAMCNAFSLTRGDRMEVASVILNANVESYRQLDSTEIRRLRDALEGAVLVCKIQMERRRGERV